MRLLGRVFPRQSYLVSAVDEAERFLRYAQCLSIIGADGLLFRHTIVVLKRPEFPHHVRQLAVVFLDVERLRVACERARCLAVRVRRSNAGSSKRCQPSDWFSNLASNFRQRRVEFRMIESDEKIHVCLPVHSWKLDRAQVCPVFTLGAHNKKIKQCKIINSG